MSDLAFALLIVGVCAAPILRPLLGLTVHRVHARVASPRPRRPIAYDERDLLHTDPREWVRQAERAVEAEQGKRPAEPHAAIASGEYVVSARQLACRHIAWANDTRLCDPAPRYRCADCGIERGQR